MQRIFLFHRRTFQQILVKPGVGILQIMAMTSGYLLQELCPTFAHQDSSFQWEHLLFCFQSTKGKNLVGAGKEFFIILWFVAFSFFLSWRDLLDLASLFQLLLMYTMVEVLGPFLENTHRIRANGCFGEIRSLQQWK
jgi:hypothetical protein